MVITVSENDRYYVMAVEGSLTAENRAQLERCLDDTLKAGMHGILDLDHVGFIDSATLGLIVLYHSRFQEAGRRMIVVNINRQIYQMFSLTGLIARLLIFGNRDEAIASLEGSNQ